MQRSTAWRGEDLTERSASTSVRRALRDLPTATPRPLPSLGATAACFCAIAALAAVAYWPRIAHPALYRDDWQFAYSQVAHPHGYLLFGIHEAVIHNRPIYLLINHLLTWGFGTHATALLLIGLALDALVCTAAFVLLSVLGMGRWTAGVLAALLMVYPLADSTRLQWSIAPTNLGAGFYLVGATLAILSLTYPSRQGRRLQAAAIVCYLLSLLTYESAAGFIVLSFLVYRLVVPWRAALRQWRIDIAILGVLFGAFLIVNRLFGEHVNNVVSPAHLIGRVAVFAYESVGAVALSVFPAGPALVTTLVVAERTAALAGLVLVVVGAYVWLRRRGIWMPSSSIAGWGWTIAAATVALVLAYLPYVIAAGAYHPLARGEGNRTNQLAALPLLVIGYGLLRIAWALVVSGQTALTQRGRAASRAAYLIVPAAALIIASAITVRGDITRWRFTAQRQGQLQAMVTRELAGDKRRVGVVVIGPLDLFSPGIPHPAKHEVISLEGTFSVPLGRVLGPEYLVSPGTRFTCTTSSVFPAAFPEYVSGYGQTLVLRAPWTRPEAITDRRACLEQLGTPA